MKSNYKALLEEINKRAQSQTIKDMADWRRAKREATNPDMPKRVRLTGIVEDMLFDTHLSSQIELRVDRSMSKNYTIYKHEKADDECTKKLQDSEAFANLLRTLIETVGWGHSLVELLPDASGKDLFSLSLLPRAHVVPQLGILLRNTSDLSGIDYRAHKQYGTRILEFGQPDDLGILFDCVPATIIRRYALTGWSEFCEIYGIPPRTLKVDTTDDAAMQRAKEMMRNMGASAWSIVDNNEELTFATGVSDNGDIFDKLIKVSSQEISLKICGAVIGQDTINGNRSKEDSSIKLLDSKCAADRTRAEYTINRTILPALARIGVFPEGLTFRYDQDEDTDALWNRTVQIMPHAPISTEWIRNKFGIEFAEGTQQTNTNKGTEQTLFADPFFG